MKNLKSPLLIAVLAISSLLFTRCSLTEDLDKISNSLDSVRLIVATPEFNAMAHIELIDAKTKQYILKDANVIVSGKDADYIFNNIGASLTSQLKSSGGMLDLVVDPHRVIASTLQLNPIEFDVTISLAGYASVTKKIIISENKFKTVPITLLNLNDAPEGVSVASNTNFASSANGVVANTATTALNGGNQTIEIPAGVVLKDASGNTISGTVKSQIIYYDPITEDAQNAIPGGLSVSAKLQDGTNDQIRFVSAGMFGVTLTAGNQVVKNFENGGLNIKTTVPSTLINPNTGLPVKDGDQIEMWSQEEGTGSWVFDRVSTVKKVGEELVLEETVQHLSSWNWDFHINECYLGPKIIWKGNTTGANVRMNTILPYYGYNLNFVTNTYVKPNDQYYGNLQIYNSPKNTPTTLEFSSPDGNSTISPSSISIANLCSGDTYEVTVTSAPVDMITAKIDLTATSKSNTRIAIKPNAYIYYWTANDWYWNYLYMSSGVTSLNIRVGQEINVAGYFGSSFGYGTFKVEDAGSGMLKVTLTPTLDYNTGLKGASISYTVSRPVNNVVDIKYNAIVSDNILNQLR
ncbi:MAG: hypothetical protein PHV20_03275 [Bacteroidales bacterium]|nr:hypothetical protein [Bacteroidales bacterium]